MRGVVLALVACTAFVSGCGRSGSEGVPPAPAEAPAAPAGPDFSRPLNALGNEPFWSLKIRPEGLSFSAPSTPDIGGPNTGPKAAADQAVWSATGSDGRPLVATLKAAVCEDAMSGASYPFTATVEAGGRTLKGCAAYAGSMPRPGG